MKMFENQNCFYRLSKLVQVLGVSEATLWRWIREGKFPKGTKLSKGVTAWHSKSLADWESHLGTQGEDL